MQQAKLVGQEASSKWMAVDACMQQAAVRLQPVQHCSLSVASSIKVVWEGAASARPICFGVGSEQRVFFEVFIRLCRV
jgi:hypothetical protein